MVLSRGKKRPGDPLEISADEWNSILDVRDFIRDRFFGSSASAIATQFADRFGVVKIRNNHSADVGSFSVMAFERTFMFDPDTPAGLDQFKQFPPIVSCKQPTDDDEGNYCICIEPIKQGEVGRAVAIGVVQVQVDFASSGDKFARVVDEDETKLDSSSVSGVEVIAKQDGTGVKWALVRLGSGGSGNGEEKRSLLEGALGNLGTATARVTIWSKGYDLSTSTGTVTAGTFYFTFKSIDSANLNWNATAAQIQTELENFEDLDSDNCYVYGGALPGDPVTITIDTREPLSITTSLTGGDFALTKLNDEWTESAETIEVRDILGICGSLPVGAILISRSIDEVDNAVVAANCSCNEIQQVQITGTPTAGTFTLTFDAQTTAAIDWDATAADIEDALEALSTIGSGNVRCSGGNIDAAPVLIEFAGTLGGSEQAAITVGTDSVTGGTVVVSTVVDGG